MRQHWAVAAAVGVTAVLLSAWGIYGDGGPPPFLGIGCLAKEGPVLVDDCFAEFLETGRQNKQDWFDFVAAQGRRIYYNQEEAELRIHKTRPTDTPLSVGPSRSPERTLAVRGTTRYKEVPYLSSGGFFNLITLRPGLPGHAEVTADVLGNRHPDAFRFSRVALLIAMDAAQDADFYEWRENGAHAQTPSTDAALITRVEDRENGRQGRLDFIAWLVHRVNALRQYCGAPTSIKYATYLLGYTLHGIQDLAAHNGRSDAEHSFNHYCFKKTCEGRSSRDGDPDEVLDHIEIAREFSRLFLRTVRTYVGDQCWVSMREYTGDIVTQPEKVTVIRSKQDGWDLTKKEFERYRKKALTFARLEPAAAVEIRWLGRLEWVDATAAKRKEILTIFDEQVMNPFRGGLAT